MTMTRLDRQHWEVIDRTAPLSFHWNGKRVSGYRGDTIASALAASGEQVFSRSMKYHRPRGILTADYWDPNLLVQVAEEPNVRAGHRLLEEGMDVRAQNAWPSLHRDLKASTRLLGRFMVAGFYYKTFMRPRWLWPLYERVLSTYAPGGRVDLDSPRGYHDQRYAHPDVVVAGAGPAGIEAALAAAEIGAQVLLVEHEHTVGGHLRYSSRPADRIDLCDLRSALEKSDVEVLTDSTVTGRYEDNWLAIVQRSHPAASERLIKARAKVLVAAPGLIERPYVFAGNDRPGVITSGAARRLINLWAVKPGTRAVVFTANQEGDAAVSALEGAGVEIAAVIDGRQGRRINSTRGSARALRGVIADGSLIRADLLVVAAGWTAPTSLLNMAGDRPAFDRSAARFFPSDPPGNVLATGGLSGDGTVEELRSHGTATGRLAAARASVMAHRLQARTVRAAPVEGPQPGWAPDDRAPLARQHHPALFRSDTHGMVDFSEDVTSKDLVLAAREGYDSIELAKRYTTATMGSSQGKLETVNTVAVIAEARGETIDQVGTTVWRPPYAPLTLGALAGRQFEPVRVSPLQPWHEANGAHPIVAGHWIRPGHYGDPVAEVNNTRTNVGLIDVTPLGKFDLRGPDVPLLLDLLYTNKWSNLKVGKVRYGMMCSEDGVILDDGVTGRLGEEHYMMTTTTAGARSVWEWMENWLQTQHPDWKVHVTPVTAGFASINVAGPKARRLVGRITSDIDLSPEAFSHMEVRQGTVAGVAGCFMWRIGFTGELSYELHVPAGHGMHVWETLLDEGADLGVRPFGLETQRILRLEKGHIIVGQDTDALTLATSTGLSHLIKLDKQDFAGKPELAWAQGRRLPMIVAIQPNDPHTAPEEGCQIVDGQTNRVLGRITSSRMSPTLRRAICLGQVTPDLAVGGSEVTLLLPSGERVRATVMGRHSHFDPAGGRIRA